MPVIDMTVADERPLSEDEISLLQWLVDHGRPDAAKYRSQIPKLRVVSRCGCGCPSIDVAIGTPKEPRASHIIADGEAKSPEGAHVGIILHVRDGEISELEVYSMNGQDTVFTLPKPEGITLWPE